MKRASFAKVFLWSAALAWGCLIVVLAPIRMANMGDALLPALGVTALVGLGLACLFGFLVAGCHLVARKGRQERKARLPCGYERACELCLASLELFPSFEVLEYDPGAWLVLVRNNALLDRVPGRARRVLPDDWNWVETIQFDVQRAGDGETTVTLVARLDANSVLHVLVDRVRYNVDRIVEYLDEKSRGDMPPPG